MIFLAITKVRGSRTCLCRRKVLSHIRTFEGVKVICGIASGALLGKKLGDIVVLAPPMLKMLPTMFAWPQLFTALIGGAVALLITPVLRKALHR